MRWAIALCLVLLVGLAGVAQGQVDLPTPRLDQQISIEADQADHWTQGAYEVWTLHGNCLISQGLTYARASDGVIWVERGGPLGDPPHKVIVYLEGAVSIDYQEGEDGVVKSEGRSLQARYRQDLVRPPVFVVAAQAALPGAGRSGTQGQAGGVRAWHAGA